MHVVSNFTRRGRVLALVATLALALPFAACVEDVGLVNRTDGDKIDKRLFEGNWLFVQTTADVPYSSAVSFTGETNFGGTAKIIFDVQEKWLIAYPIVETVVGTEEGYRFQSIRKYWDPDHRDEFQEMYVGQPLAKWPIKSHFDVIRDYNTYNGAQSNEVVENTKDRPWWQRDFIRVGWHQQDVRDFFYDLKGGQGSDSYFVAQDKQGEPDEMTIDVDGGYFDFIVRSDVWSAGQDYCSTFGLSPYDCAKTEVKVRNSFRRLDPRRDYQPIRYHNNEQQEKFGFFSSEIPYYDEDFGPSYDGKRAFANRWNIWKDTYDFKKPVDDSGNEVTLACHNDYECNTQDGERCQRDQTWFGEGYCATPVAKRYSERGQRPIIYHLNTDWHPDFIADAYATAAGWNDVFKDAVSWLLLYDERGEAETRSCTTSADCTVPGILLDEMVTYSYSGIPCHTDGQCGTAKCGGDGFCGNPRTCNATTPCAIGQTCSSGQCTLGGQPVVKRINATRNRGSSVIYGGAASVITHDTIDQSTVAALGLGPAASLVRFIHLAPDAGNLGLTVNGVTIPGGQYDATRDYDPQDLATVNFMGAVPPGSGLSFTVVRDGAQVATLPADLAANASYTVVYNGTDVRVYGVPLNGGNQGVRFIHMAADTARLDFALTGVRLGKAISYWEFTPYQVFSGSLIRATVTPAGGRGDLTCYTTNSIGRCVGWSAELDDKAIARREEIKRDMPDMFLLCQNKFDANEAFDQANVTSAKATKATILEGEPDRDGGYYGDAWYTYTRDGELYNPCNDTQLVPHPTDAKKIGDIRYSFFYWVNEAMRAGPLGYGPSMADPQTGQIITATANIYGGGLLSYGQYAADILGLINGDISTDDMVTGRWVREYLKNKAADEDPDLATQFGAATAEAGAGAQIDPHAAMRDHKGIDLHTGHAHPAMNLKTAARIPQMYEFPEMMEHLRHPEKLKADIEQAFPTVDPGYYQDRLNRVRGTWMEQLLINNEVRVAEKAIDPAGEMSRDQLNALLSPASWSSQSALRAEENRTRFFAERNMYMADFVDDSLWGLAKELEAKGLDPVEFRKEVSRRILRGVLEHEVGHTIGLRHNFSGSTDAFNYFDEYYNIREQSVILCQENSWCDQYTKQVCAFQACTQDSDCFSGICQAGECVAPTNAEATTQVPTGVCAQPVGDTSCSTNAQCGTDELCFATRCHSLIEQMVPRGFITDNEKAAKRTEFQYSTVMDYGAKINSDVHGLGKYDYAAIRYGYTQLVDTYTDRSRLDARVQSGAEVTGQPLTDLSFFYNTRNWPTRGTGGYHVFDYLTNYIGVEENLKRTPRPYDQVKYQRDMVVNDRREYIDLESIEVPYAYCSDEYRGNAGCYYFDQGLDMEEMAGNAVDQLEQYYVFDAFKRERLYYGQYEALRLLQPILTATSASSATPASTTGSSTRSSSATAGTSRGATARSAAAPSSVPRATRLAAVAGHRLVAGAGLVHLRHEPQRLREHQPRDRRTGQPARHPAGYRALPVHPLRLRAGLHLRRAPRGSAASGRRSRR
ncbi:MAG: zinc-dependent metalloprotease [Myxococcota bacterium]